MPQLLGAKALDLLHPSCGEAALSEHPEDQEQQQSQEQVAPDLGREGWNQSRQCVLGGRSMSVTMSIIIATDGCNIKLQRLTKLG